MQKNIRNYVRNLQKILFTYVDAVRFRRVIIGLGSCKCVLVLFGESSLLKPMSLDMIKLNTYLFRESLFHGRKLSRSLTKWTSNAKSNPQF